MLAAFMFFVAWGEWNCGLNTFQIVLANLIGAVGLSVSIILWRQTAPADQRFSYMMVLLPWVILGAVTVFVFTLAPDCSFPSR